MWQAAVAAGQAFMGVVGAMESARLARVQARLARVETDEAVRRFWAGGMARLSSARAIGAASGIEADSSSLSTYLDAMTKEMTRQGDWMRDAGYAGIDITKQAANARFVGDIGSTVFDFAKSMNWWLSSKDK